MAIKTQEYEASFKKLKFLIGGVKGSKKSLNSGDIRKKLILIRDCLTCIISMSCDDIAKINGVLKGRTM